jgi:hypothetical protein
MKTSFIIKVLILLPAILFIDYLVMIIVGCSSCLFGLGEDFICGYYCIFGKIILAMSALFFFYLILPDLKAIINSIFHGKTT